MDKKTAYTSVQEVTTEIIREPNMFRSWSLLSYGTNRRRLVFVDSFFYQQDDWKEKISNYFHGYCVEATIVPVDCSEDKKDLENLMFILGHVERFNILRRDEPIIAIGGGVLMDMVGFASSIFRRGVPYIKVPTTLLGMVDAGLGAKTSINHFDRRNRLGSYFPPVATIIDKQFLKTLDPQEITYAMGEIIKIAVIKDYQLFKKIDVGMELCLESQFQCSIGNSIIERSATAMMDELTPNLWEEDLERVVDFGHTFSPIPEMKSLTDDSVPTLSHGEAVALDVLFSCRLSRYRGLLKGTEYNAVADIIKRSKLPLKHPYFEDPYILWDSLLDATRHRNGNQNVPVPTRVGTSIFLNDITLEEIKGAVHE